MLAVNPLPLEPEWTVSLEDLGIFVAFNYFYNTSRFAVDEKGGIVGIDFSENQLVLIDSNGKKTGRASRSGEGPGEMASPDGIGWVPESEVWMVTDRGKLKVLVFDRQGQYLEEFPFAEKLRNPAFLNRNELFFIRKYAGKERNEPTILKLNLAEQQAETVYTTTITPTLVNLSWTPTLIYGQGKDFLAINYGGAPELTLLDLKDGGLKSLNLDIPRVPITDDFYERYMQGVRKDLPQYLHLIERPEYWPYISRIMVDDRNLIWIFLHREVIHEKGLCFVFDAKGGKKFEGRVSGWPQAIKDGHLYMVSADADETLFLTKYAIHFSDK